ncbi:hypothetical protein ACQEVZ_17170 [Dactylosporangium sp. CA-152071]|uniref:hypothetical protein n=1 Tax=Dactylosporangium sp. CA-152071 TaxID=3239933 RepID=UPI003D8E9867
MGNPDIHGDIWGLRRVLWLELGLPALAADLSFFLPAHARPEMPAGPGHRRRARPRT